MTTPSYGFRFGRFGTAMVLLTLPLTLPVFAIGGAALEAWEICRDTFGTLPSAARFVWRGFP
jgi:hypothetical protein